MALNKDRWGAARAAAITAQGVTAGTPISPSQLEAMWKAISEADVEEITMNAEVSTVDTGLVLTGLGAGGTTSGTGTGTIA